MALLFSRRSLHRSLPLENPELVPQDRDELADGLGLAPRDADPVPVGVRLDGGDGTGGTVVGTRKKIPLPVVVVAEPLGFLAFPSSKRIMSDLSPPAPYSSRTLRTTAPFLSRLRIFTRSERSMSSA